MVPHPAFTYVYTSVYISCFFHGVSTTTTKNGIGILFLYFMFFKQVLISNVLVKQYLQQKWKMFLICFYSPCSFERGCHS